VVPFGTTLLVRYDGDPAARKMYGFLLFWIAIMRLAIWWYAVGRPKILFAPG
jgi:hypothetical protein